MAHLLKMFDDLKHYQNELARSNEEEVFTLLDACEHMRQKWNASEHELDGLRRILSSFETDLSKSRFENKELRSQLVEARSQVSALATAREELERQRIVLEKQVDLVRDLLRDEVNTLPEYNRKKLQFLIDRPSTATLARKNESSVVSEAIDYDRTEDSLDAEVVGQRNSKSNGDAGRSKRSRSNSQPTAPPVEDHDDLTTPRKRSKDENEPSDRNRSSGVGAIYGEGRTSMHRTPLNRSFSEPHMGLVQPSLKPMKSTADLAVLSPATAPTNGRRHTFLQKTSFKVEYCDYCDRRFSFASAVWRCEVCKMQCHAACREYALLPCIARGTPAAKNQRGFLSDFAPREPPMIPNVIVHCVNEIERRGLGIVGLYRVSGKEADVNELLDRFLFGRGVPNLRLVIDVSVLTSCIKKFLQHLAEPLIPSTSWHEFVKAASMTDRIREALPLLHQAIIDLPQPNRDTLAFFIIHLQRVAEFSHENKMPVANLAQVLGPTVVGYSGPLTDLHQGLSESPQQEAVMKLLLDLSPEYWGRFLTQSENRPLLGSASSGDVFGQVKGTPGATTSTGLTKFNLMPTTPKSAPYNTRSQRKFFNPPWK